MNALTELHQQALTMSSREIAELTGKEHKNVMADVRKMLEDLDFSPAEFSARYKDAQGKPREYFNLPKDLTLTLVAGYNVKLRKRIIDRWLELESQQPAPQFRIPQTMSEALRLAADLSEQNAKLAERVEEDRPKVEFFDVVAQTEDVLTVSDAAKILGTGEKRLFTMLRECGYLLKDKPVPYQKCIDLGLFDVKLSSWKHPKTGNINVRKQALITGKGLQYLQRHYFKPAGVQIPLIRKNPNPPGQFKPGSAASKILTLFSEQPDRCFREAEIIESIGASRAAVTCALQSLEHYGHVMQVPSSENARYSLWRARLNPMPTSIVVEQESAARH